MGFDWKAAAGLPPMDACYGVVPKRAAIRRLTNYTLIEPCGIHENPRFFKYTWRIWALDNTADPVEVPVNWYDRPSFNARSPMVPTLPFAQAMRRMQQLVAERQFFFALIEPYKRDDPGAPWDFARLRASGAMLAKAYDDDQDEAFHGHR